MKLIEKRGTLWLASPVAGTTKGVFVADVLPAGLIPLVAAEVQVGVVVVPIAAPKAGEIDGDGVVSMASAL